MHVESCVFQPHLWKDWLFSLCWFCDLSVISLLSLPVSVPGLSILFSQHSIIYCLPYYIDYSKFMVSLFFRRFILMHLKVRFIEKSWLKFGATLVNSPNGQNGWVLKQSKPRELLLGLPHGFRIPKTWTLLCCFPKPQAGVWITNGEAGTHLYGILEPTEKEWTRWAIVSLPIVHLKAVLVCPH